MQRFRKILVGVDLCDGGRAAGSELSDSCCTAVEKALWLASHTSADVTFFSSLLPCLDLSPDIRQLSELRSYQSAIDSIHEHAAVRMASLVKEAESCGVRATAVRLAGKPWLELLREAVTGDYDLVIVGSHKQHSIGRTLLGNTGRRLIRKCPCPVWVTSPIEGGQVRRILVPTDFSEPATESLRLAGSLARQLDAELHVLHAREYHFERQIRDLIVSHDKVEEHRSRMQADAEQQLADTVAECELGDIVSRTQRYVSVGPPFGVIREAVEDLSVDLVVMSTLARSGIKGMLIGNTAEQVLAHLTCSILAIKPEGFECPIEFPLVDESQDSPAA